MSSRRLRRVLPLAVAAVVCLPGSVRARHVNVVPVRDVEGLYDAVNDASNAGAVVMLAPGEYVLTALDPSGTLRPNGGRLELQPGMSLLGSVGRSEDVVIDGSQPDGPSYVITGGNAGPIRIGRGRDAVEWLTVRGAASAAAGITTDLVGARVAWLRVAHVVSEGSVRGIDVRNFGAAAAGRVIVIDLDGNEFWNNRAGNGQGVRFVNANGADDAAIVANSHDNRSHDNLSGCLAGNLASSRASVTVESHHDTFDDNLVGCVLIGGVTQAAADTADGNVVRFFADGDSFRDNTGALAPSGDAGGVVVVGGFGAAADSTSRNSVAVSIRGSRFGGNVGPDVSAWGAQSFAGAPAGTHNVVYLDLDGLSRQASVAAIDSVPTEPARTNRVIVLK